MDRHLLKLFAGICIWFQQVARTKSHPWCSSSVAEGTLADIVMQPDVMEQSCYGPGKNRRQP